MAKGDLEASKCLFNEKLYSQAVFHLQQAVEKAVKSLGIYTGRITEAEAKKDIGHNAWKLFAKDIRESIAKMKSMKQLLENFPKLREVSFLRRLDIDELSRQATKAEKFLTRPLARMRSGTFPFQ